MDNDLKKAIAEDREYYFGRGVKRIYRCFTHNPLFQRGRYIIAARKAGYYRKNSKSLVSKLMLLYYTRKKNCLGEKLGIELGPDQFGRRLKIYHNNIVVNAGTVIGDDCEAYGDNCIGNKGSHSNPLDAPSIGNHVSFGVGAKAVGKIDIANGVKISGMSFVNKNLTEEKSLYGGVPAKFIKKIADQ